MLKIYGVPISVHTRKVIVAAIEKKLKFENEPVIPFNPPAGWDRLSPTGKIPVMSDGDFELAEFVGHLRLPGADPSGARLVPARGAGSGRAPCGWRNIATAPLFREVVHGLFFQNVIRPKILKQETDRAAIDAILQPGAAQGVRLSGERRGRRLPGRRAVRHRRHRPRLEPGELPLSRLPDRRGALSEAGSPVQAAVPASLRSQPRCARSSRWRRAWVSMSDAIDALIAAHA